MRFNLSVTAPGDRKSLDRLRQMETFLRVSRTGSFTAVAEQQGLSPAAIARHVNVLEAALGVRLLNRSTRSISLTDAGRTYAELCEAVIEQINQCESILSLVEKSPKGTIKMIVPKSFGVMQLGDAVIEFANMHPDISLSIALEDFSSKPYDFVDRGYDLALRWGADLHESTLVATYLGSVVRKLCATPHYVQTHGAPETPADLERHNCLVHLSANADQIWRFMDPVQEVGVKVGGDFASDSALMLRKAALAHRGVVMLPLYCIQEDLQSGALVELLPDYPSPENPLCLIYRERRLLPSRVRLFIDFLREWFHRNGDTPTSELRSFR